MKVRFFVKLVVSLIFKIQSLIRYIAQNIFYKNRLKLVYAILFCAVPLFSISQTSCSVQETFTLDCSSCAGCLCGTGSTLTYNQVCIERGYPQHVVGSIVPYGHKPCNFFAQWGGAAWGCDDCTSCTPSNAIREITCERTVTLNAGADVAYCTGGSVAIGTAPIAGYTYSWSPTTGLSDPTSSNPTISLTNAGTMDLVTTYQLTATGNGCSMTDGVQVTVYASPGLPDFSFNNTCANEQPITFSDISMLNNPVTYSWDFGDNMTAAGNNVSHTYATDGVYNVTMEITSTSNSCKSTVTHPVTIFPEPIVSFTADSVCLNVPPTNFNDLSTVSSGNITNWEWDFRDGGTDVGNPTPSYIFTSDSSHHVKLKVTTDKGCRDSIVRQVVVHPLPVADFKPDTVCLRDSTQFVDLSTISSGAVTGWAWLFDDGSPINFQQNPTHLYDLGSYNVVLLATSDKGCQSDTTKPVGIYPLPVAGFFDTRNCVNEQPTIFTDTSSAPSGNTVVSWEWDFGDGVGSSMQANPNYVYNSEGQYMVKQIVTSDKTCTDTLEKLVNIYPPPQTDFSAGTTSGCEPFCLTFTDNTVIPQGSIASWKWNTGISGAMPDTVQHLSTCYNERGIYTVTLITTSDKGCKDTLIRPDYITVWPLPVADFSASPQSTNIQDMNITFSDFSFVPSGQPDDIITEWEWTFYDNDSNLVKGVSSSINPEFNFASNQSNPYIFFLHDTGYYPVKLLTKTANGCLDSIIEPIKVNGVYYANVPNAFTPNGDNINDEFFPVGIGIDPNIDFNFYIYDRWGDLIFQSHNLGIPWDGIAHEKGGVDIVEEGTYIWKLEFRDITENKGIHRMEGHVMVLR